MPAFTRTYYNVIEKPDIKKTNSVFNLAVAVHYQIKKKLILDVTIYVLVFLSAFVAWVLVSQQFARQFPAIIC